jgi:hypothetical protein
MLIHFTRFVICFYENDEIKYLMFQKNIQSVPNAVTALDKATMSDSQEEAIHWMQFFSVMHAKKYGNCLKVLPIPLKAEVDTEALNTLIMGIRV